MKKINESFLCIHCGRDVERATKTCRNHCPWCFASQHVDSDIPGDRKAICGGVMYPTMYEIRNGTLKILFRCSLCGKEHWNKRGDDDQVEKLDDYIKQYKSKIL